MSSNTSGGIASTTLVCSLGMSVVDKASAKFKGNKRSLAKQSQVTSNCGLVLALAMRYLARLQLVYRALHHFHVFSRSSSNMFPRAEHQLYVLPRPLPAAYFSRAKEKQKP